MPRKSSRKEVEKGEPKNGEVISIFQPGEDVMVDITDVTCLMRFRVYEKETEVKGGKVMLWLTPATDLAYLLPASYVVGRQAECDELAEAV